MLLHESCAVGYGGLPNSEGSMEMDAAIMDGGASPESTGSPRQSTANRLGAVCALPEQIRLDLPHSAGTTLEAWFSSFSLVFDS